jgi:hypothetical protein
MRHEIDWKYPAQNAKLNPPRSGSLEQIVERERLRCRRLNG